MKKLYDIMEKKKKLYESLNKCTNHIEEKKKLLKMIDDDNYLPIDKEDSVMSLKKTPSPSPHK